MITKQYQVSIRTGKSRRKLLWIGTFFLSLAVTFIAGLVFMDLKRMGTLDILLILLSIAVGVVSIVPAVISLRSHNHSFDFFHPLLYAAWFFFIPQFAFAGIFLAFNAIQSSFSALLMDQRYFQIQTLMMVILGSLGLSFGYFLYIGRWMGDKLPTLRVFSAPPEALKKAAFIFLLIGFMAQIKAFEEGLIGYQFNADISSTEAIFASFASLAVVGQGIVWFCFFRNRGNWWFFALMASLLILFDVFISGSRGALFHAMIPIIAGYQYTRKKDRFRKMWKWFLILVIVVFIGMIFGTMFRINVLSAYGRTTSLTISDVTNFSSETIRSVRQQSFGGVVQFGWQKILERMDALSSMAVIVANAERLKGAEIALGIHNNIIRDSFTSFIPRIIWPSKPIVGGAEVIGNLYFYTKYNSPAVTYMGDLFRNFGVWGIFPGMMLIGIALRTIYRWLIEGRQLTPMRVGIFMLLGFTVHYESMYSSFLPSLVRKMFMIVIGVLLVSFLLSSAKPRATSLPQ